MAGFGDRLKHAWNAFQRNEAEERLQPRAEYFGPSYGLRPDRTRLRISNERSIISSIYTRLSVDVASVDIRHVRLDDQKRYLEDIDSGLNNCLTLEANVDQAATAFRRDVAMTLFDKGTAVIVPVDTSISPQKSGGFDILTVRVGEVVTWYPHHVRISLYNERSGNREEITLLKSAVAIVENPLYAVMNETNSTLQRLIHKLNLIDAIDDQSASGKLDLIIQLPYVIKSEARREQAEQRRKDVEFQLKGSKYGVAYTDGTEKITQLNRPVENNLMTQIEYLTTMLYGQLGLTEEIMNGTADEAAMLNYMNRTIEPTLTAIVESMRRVFLTKTARSQKQSVVFFRDPFKLVPIVNIAEIADKFTRNEIMSSNEVRQAIGMAPSKEPKADQLINSNMPTSDTGVGAAQSPEEALGPEFDAIDADVNAALDSAGVAHAGVPYDPVKAHEYYVRNRELKGRKPGGAKPATVPRVGGAPKAPLAKKGIQQPPGERKLSPKELKEQRAYAAMRIVKVKQALGKLQVELKKRETALREAEAATRKTAAKEKRGPTAADKAESARDASKYRDEHKQEIASKAKKAAAKDGDTKASPEARVADAKAAVDQVKSAIDTVKARLDTAVEKQKSLG
jgi:hypothetical protein